ncbi:MAG: glycoside hydrolase family 88 protein [Prolixibacteraceae bacterium]
MRIKMTGMFLKVVVLLFVGAGLHNCTEAEVVKGIAADGLSEQFSILLSNANASYDSKITRGKRNFFPRSMDGNGIAYVESGDWCSGFFPGCLWQMAMMTNDSMWKAEALKYTRLMEREKNNGSSHDVGFKIMCSFGQAVKMLDDPTEFNAIIVQAAKTLSKRFNPNVGCIRSWDWNSDKWKYPVIIDNMMNLELLFKATQICGDSTYFNIAVSHANTTLRNHFRSENSSYHVVDYNPSTGNVISKFTHQGDSNESAWARGQAWGLYGYTMMYRETHNIIYLQQAEKIAAFIFDNGSLPLDKIVMWDFNYDESSGEPRDVSAAAVIASALVDLSDFAPSNEENYRQLARQILDTLISSYATQQGGSFGYLLKHSVGFKHNNSEVDVPIIYADYYFLEALNRYNNLIN